MITYGLTIPATGGEGLRLEFYYCIRQLHLFPFWVCFYQTSFRKIPYMEGAFWLPFLGLRCWPARDSYLRCAAPIQAGSLGLSQHDTLLGSDWLSAYDAVVSGRVLAHTNEDAP